MSSRHSSVFSRASRMLRDATQVVRMPCVCVCVWKFFFRTTPRNILANTPDFIVTCYRHPRGNATRTLQETAPVEFQLIIILCYAKRQHMKKLQHTIKSHNKKTTN